MTLWLPLAMLWALDKPMEQFPECHCVCANCEEVITYRAAQVGQTIECPKCGEKSELPKPEFKTCTKCGERLRFSAKKCAPCEAERRGKNFRLVAKVSASVLGVVMIAFVLWWLCKPKPTQTKTKSPTILIAQPHVRAQKSTNDFHMSAFTIQKKRGDDLMTAAGDIQNTSDNVHVRLRVDLDVLDKNNAKIGTVTDYCVELAAYQTWHFLATVNESNAVGLRFAKLTEE